MLTTATRCSPPSRGAISKRICKRMRGVVALIIVQLTALASAGAALAGDDITSSSGTMTLSPDGIPWERPTACVNQREVTGGGVRLSAPAEDFIQGTFPLDDVAWLGVGSRPDAFTTSSTMTVFARCVKRSANVVYRTKTNELPSVGNPLAATAKCPRGTTLTGGGVRLLRGVQPRLAGIADGFLAAGSHPAGRRGWTGVGIRPPGSEEPPLQAYAACLKSRMPMARRSNTEPMPNHGEVYTARAKCPPRTEVTGGGVQLSHPFADLVKGSFPKGERTWVAKAMVGGGGVDPEVTAYALCLK